MEIILNGIPFPILELPAITKKVNDISSLGDRGGDASTTFKIPKTEQTIKDFERANNLSSETNLPYRYFRAQLPQIGVNFGLAKLERVNDSFELVLYSGLINFFVDIRGKKLNEIDLSEFDHIWNKTDIELYLNRDEGFSYALADFGTFPTDQSPGDLSFDNLRPFIYNLTILNKIIEEAGWTLKGNLFESDEFSETVLPWGSEDWANGQRYIDENGININQSPGELSLSGSFPGGGAVEKKIVALPWSLYNHSGQVLEVELKGVQTFTEFILSPDVGAALQFVLNGVIQPQISAAITGAGTFEVNESFILNNGDQLELAVIYGQPAGTDQAFNYNFTYNGGFIETTFLDNKIRYGAEVHLEALLPDVTQEKYILELCRLYGLTIEVNPIEKTVFFFSWDELFNNKFNAYKFDDLIDSASVKGAQIEFKFNDYAQINNLKWAEDESIIGDYNGEILIDDKTLLSEVDLFELEFGASDETSGRLNAFNLQILKINRFENNFPVVGEIEYFEIDPPRYCALSTFQSPQSFVIDTGNYNDGTLTINQDIEVKRAYFSSGSFPLQLNKLKERHFLKLETSTLKRVKRVSILANLTRNFVLNLEFFKPVSITYFGEFFYIISIKNFTGEGLTEIELLRL